MSQGGGEPSATDQQWRKVHTSRSSRNTPYS